MSNSKVWVYQADRVLNATEENAIQQEVDAFLAEWKAHGKGLFAEFEIRHHRFLILKVDERFQGATGCSIDKSVHFFKQLGQAYGIELFDRHRFAYEHNGQVHSDRLTNLTDLVQQGYVTDHTVVYNNLVGTLDELENQFRIPFGQSWHRRMVKPAVLQS